MPWRRYGLRCVLYTRGAFAFFKFGCKLVPITEPIIRSVKTLPHKLLFGVCKQETRLCLIWHQKNTCDTNKNSKDSLQVKNPLPSVLTGDAVHFADGRGQETGEGATK